MFLPAGGHIASDREVTGDGSPSDREPSPVTFMISVEKP